MWLRVMIAACAVWALYSGQSFAQDVSSREVIKDDEAGYVLPLPAGWKEIKDARKLRALVDTVCSIFATDGEIPGASHIRAAMPPDSGEISQALVVFSLDYARLGLGQQAVRDIAKDAQTAVAALVNGLQVSYMEMFPQTIMVNHQLGDMFGSLQVRSVLDFGDEAGSTRNQTLKVMLTSDGALVLATLYTGLSNAARETAVAASVREMVVLPEKSLQRVSPPFQASGLDYVLVVLAVFALIMLVGKVRSFMRG